MTEFRGAAKRRTRGGQGPATEPSHRVDRVQGRGQEEDKRRTRPRAREGQQGGQGLDTEPGRGLEEAKRRTRPSHGAQPQS